MPDEAKQEALAAVLAIPGVSTARWRGEEPVTDAGEGSTGDSADPATEAKIADCQAEVDKMVGERKITFRSGSAYVSPEANRILDDLAEALKACSGLAVAVGGHTDDNGNAQVNKTMSQERADRIKAGLVERGISESQLTATGFGSEQPLVQGSDAAADAQNRRIEFTIGPAAAAAAVDADPQQGE